MQNDWGQVKYQISQTHLVMPRVSIFLGNFPVATITITISSSSSSSADEIRVLQIILSVGFPSLPMNARFSLVHFLFRVP